MFKQFNFKWISAIGILIFFLLIVGCSNENNSTETSKNNNNLNENSSEEINNENEQSINNEEDKNEQSINDYEPLKEDENNDNEKNVIKELDINDQAKNHAYDIINDYEMVKDSHIKVSETDEEITLAIIVNNATNEEHAKELGDNFARALASGVAIFSEENLESPSKEYLGELYEIYDLDIGVGTSPDDFIARGYMISGGSNITW